MKKHLFCILTALMLLGSGCSRSGGYIPAAPSPSPGPAAVSPDSPALAGKLLADYLDGLDELETPVRAYGESASRMELSDDLVLRILYPAGGLTALDEAVARWVDDTAALYAEEAAGSAADGEAAELTVDYDAFLVGERLVSVRLRGIFDRPYLAHPVDLSASFNADRSTGALLSLSELLLPGGEERLRELVATQAQVAAEDVDEGLLEQWLLTPDGLEITLLRGAYLPMSNGTEIVHIPYAELEGILTLPGAQPVPTPTPEPAPEPTPTAPALPSAAVDSSRPMLALTFDDGPSAHTQRLLDAFETHGGKGTFYVVGNMLDKRADTLRRTAEAGHEIGGHSWNHRQLTKLNRQELIDQFMSTRAKIYDITGVDPTTMRPPYGSFNAQVKEVAGELGIALVNWSVDTLDWKHKNADTVYRAIMDQARDGAIILCHDLHKTTVDALERAIPDLLARGYQLVTVSELLAAGGRSLTPGQVYYKR